MTPKQPVSMLVRYIAKPGKAAALESLVARHGEVLRQTGLITDEPVRTWRGVDKRDHGSDQPYFVETFQWRDEEASSIAHQTPEVMAVWEPMGPLLESLILTTLEPLAQA